MYPLSYGGKLFKAAYRVDMIIENKVILELKSVEKILPVHKKQLLTYLKLSNKKLGLLINFNSMYLKDGVTRIVNNL
jgi:GxxExxY protein